jgi:hypothetical protein
VDTALPPILSKPTQTAGARHARQSDFRVASSRGGPLVPDGADRYLIGNQTLSGRDLLAHDARDSAVLRRRNPDVRGKEVREMALRGKSELKADIGYRAL